MQKTLKAFIEEANKKINEDASLRKILTLHFRRKRLILNLIGQANYIFNVTPEGIITLQTEKEVPIPINDMYLEMKLDLAEKIIRQRGVRLEDLPFIKFKNIKIEDIRLAIEIYKKFMP